MSNRAAGAFWFICTSSILLLAATGLAIVYHEAAIRQANTAACHRDSGTPTTTTTPTKESENSDATRN